MQYSTPVAYCRSGFGPLLHSTALEEAGIIPGKHSDTRIKPLALTNDHGRYSGFHLDPELASRDEGTPREERTRGAAGGVPCIPFSKSAFSNVENRTEPDVINKI
jgi:hypothetical protein